MHCFNSEQFVFSTSQLLNVIALIIPSASDSSIAVNRPCIGCDDDDSVLVENFAASRRRRDHLCGDVELASVHIGGGGGMPFLGRRLLCSPPPPVPDLFGAFTDSLRLQSDLVYNLTRRLFDAEPTCKAVATASLAARRGSADADDCANSPSGTAGCRRVVAGRPLSLPSSVDRQTTTTERVQIDGGREPLYGSLEVNRN